MDDVDIGDGMLSPGECRALLRAGCIGRVAVSVDALPAIFPVRYRLVDDDILFDAAPTGARLLRSPTR